MGAECRCPVSFLGGLSLEEVGSVITVLHTQYRESISSFFAPKEDGWQAQQPVSLLSAICPCLKAAQSDVHGFFLETHHVFAQKNAVLSSDAYYRKRCYVRTFI